MLLLIKYKHAGYHNHGGWWGYQNEENYFLLFLFSIHIRPNLVSFNPVLSLRTGTSPVPETLYFISSLCKTMLWFLHWFITRSGVILGL